MSFLDLTLGVCTDIVYNRIRPGASTKTVMEDVDLQDIKRAATVGPVLANAALLMSQGCPNRYMETVHELFSANGLVISGLEAVVTHKQSVDAECQTTLQLNDCQRHTSFNVVDTNQQVVVDAASQTLCIEHEDEQDMCQVNVQDMPQIVEQEIPQVMGNVSDTISNEYVTVMSERSRICEEIESLLLFDDNEDVPASFEEFGDILENFETEKEVPLNWVLMKHGLDQTFKSSYVDMDTHKTKFKGQFYALTDMDDWFDMNNSIISNGEAERRAPLAECLLSTPGPLAALKYQHTGMSTPIRNKTKSVQPTPSAVSRRKFVETPSVRFENSSAAFLRRKSFGIPSISFANSPIMNTPCSAISTSSIQNDSDFEPFGLIFHKSTLGNDSTFLTTKKATSTPVSKIDLTFNMDKFVAPDATFIPNPVNTTYKMSNTYKSNATMNLATPVNSRSVMNLLGKPMTQRPKPLCLANWRY